MQLSPWAWNCKTQWYAGKYWCKHWRSSDWYGIVINIILFLNSVIHFPNTGSFYLELFLFATGWDTDQFLTDIGEATLVMLSVVRNVCDKCVFNFHYESQIVVIENAIPWTFIIPITGRTSTRRIQLWCKIVSPLFSLTCFWLHTPYILSWWIYESYYTLVWSFSSLLNI